MSETKTEAAPKKELKELSPWEIQDIRVKLESQVGVPYKWSNGWTFWVKRLGGDWNQSYAEASARVSARPDVAAFYKRINGRNYEQTEADIQRLLTIAMDMFIEGCLVRWEGPVNRDGSPMDFNHNNASLILKHFRHDYTRMRAFCENGENFDPEVVPNSADLLGN